MNKTRSGKAKPKAKTKVKTRSRSKTNNNTEDSWGSLVSPLAVCVTLLAVSLVMVVLALPTFVLALLGLAPTWAAFITDRSHAKSRAFAMGTFNLAGTAPYFVQVWSGGRDIDVALQFLSEPLPWLIMYGAASVSLVLVWVGPLISSMISDIKDSSREKRVGRRQKELLDNWGKSIKEEAHALLVENGLLGADQPLGQANQNNN